MSTWRRALGRPAVLAHRGASRSHIENTLEALLRARELGADGVELDVRLCGSGELVVFHDEDLRRLAGDARRVLDLALAELQAVALASGVRIPTLRQVLAELDPDQIVNIEIKRADVRQLVPTARAVASDVARCVAPGRVLLSSFDPRLLLLMRRLAPGVARAHLFHARQSGVFRSLRLARSVGAAALHPEHILVDAHSIALWRRAGFRVHAWTVNEPERIEHLTRLGVDAIISDDPQLVRQVVGSAPGI